MTELVLIANATDGTISALRLHRGPGPDDSQGADHAQGAPGAARLEPLSTSGRFNGCGTFAVDTARDLVHAGYKTTDDGGGPGIATLRLDRATGELTELSRRDVEASLAYLALTPDGSVLLGASYGGGFGATWPVDVDGDTPSVGEPIGRVEHRNVHCVVPSGGVAYFVALGDDLIAQCALGADGSLTPLDPPSVAAPPGSGPRHLVVDGDEPGANAYLVTEYSGEVIRLTRGADGTLTPHEAVVVVDPSQGLGHSRFGADPTAEHLIWGADVHRAGDVIVASERSSSLLTTVALDADGHLGDVLGYTPTQAQPRGFHVTADGAYVVAVGERSTDAELYAVGDGHLTSLGTAPIGHGANWVRILS